MTSLLQSYLLSKHFTDHSNRKALMCFVAFLSEEPQGDSPDRTDSAGEAVGANAVSVAFLSDEPQGDSLYRTER